MGRPIWIRSAPWDLFWIFGGVWAPLLLLVSTAFQVHGAVLPALLLFRMLIAGFHLVLPVALAVSSPVFREARRTHPMRLLWFPLGLLIFTLLVVALAFSPSGPLVSLGETQLALGMIALSLLYVCWIDWHFAAQHFGVLSLYRSRAGQRGGAERQVDRWYCIVINLGLQNAAWLDTGLRLGVFKYLHPFGSASGVIGWSACGASAFLFLAYLAYEIRKPARSFAKILYAFTVAIQPVAAFLVPGELLLSYVFIYTFPHHLGEVGLLAHISLNEKAASKRSWLRSRFAAFWAVGIFLFALQALAHHRTQFLRLIENQGVLSVAEMATYAGEPVPMLAAMLFFGLLIQHFYFDRQIYNLKSPATGNQFAALLLSRR